MAVCSAISLFPGHGPSLGGRLEEQGENARFPSWISRRVLGHGTDGISRDLGQIEVARFANPAGLEQRGDSLYAVGPNSGLPVESSPGRAGSGNLVAGATEPSNTDIGTELVNLVTASSQFRSSLAVMKMTNTLFDDLAHPGRPR